MDMLNDILNKINDKSIYYNILLIDLVELLGKPTDQGGTSRKYKFPCVFKYGKVEFGFTPAKYKNENQYLFYIMDENHNQLLKKE